MNMNFFLPTQLITGKDCVIKNGHLLTKIGKKCLIVTSPTAAKKSGALDDVIKVLEDNGIRYELFDKIEQNPKLSTCIEAGKIAHKTHCDFILGIGGGSPLDASKCIAVLAANPKYDQDELYSLKWKHEPLKVVCVGTTSGTGSEVTMVSVITNHQGLKKSFKAHSIYPTLSFGDYKYTMSMSDYFTRSTAIDALAHCVESYFNTTANMLSRSFAMSGIQILMPILSKIGKEGSEALTEEDRENLYNGSIYGGMAINTTGTALPHAVGYLLTEQHNIPHGIACGVFLDVFMEYTKKSNPKLVQDYYDYLNMSEETYRSVIQAAMPDYDIVMDNEEIEKEHHRWLNNASIKKSLATIEADDVDQILRSLFME